MEKGLLQETILMLEALRGEVEDSETMPPHATAARGFGNTSF